jgi:hypothetical protein
MALIDDPRAWIVRLFRLEVREGRGSDCKVYADGFRTSELPLEDDEHVYGVYKNKYYFTPLALIIKNAEAIERICWAEITSCSTQHGEGAQFAKVTLRNGDTVQVQVGELAQKWTGRVSQLFHQMIARYGHSASLGARLMSFDEFFAKADDDYCLAPNLDPHPPLETLRRALSELSASDCNSTILFQVDDDDGPPTCQEIIFVTSLPHTEINEFADSYGADGVIAADDNTLRMIGKIPPHCNVWKIVWD